MGELTLEQFAAQAALSEAKRVASTCSSFEGERYMAERRAKVEAGELGLYTPDGKWTEWGAMVRDEYQRGVEVPVEGDHASTRLVDPLDALLEQVYHQLNRPALHAHTCRRCRMLRPCLQQPCQYRALDCEDSWICGECVAGEEPLAP